MKKTIIIAALAATSLAAAPARAGLNSGDWAAILGAVVEVAGAAATGYAAAQAVRANQLPTPQVMPNVFYTGWSMDPAVGLLCHYSDNSQRPYPTLADCPASFYIPE